MSHMCIYCVLYWWFVRVTHFSHPLLPPLGYTPALCCAPTPQVAECLFNILQASDQQES